MVVIFMVDWILQSDARRSKVSLPFPQHNRRVQFHRPGYFGEPSSVATTCSIASAGPRNPHT